MPPPERRARRRGTPTEEEVPRRRELRSHLHAPVQVVADGVHPEEGPCVHGAAPYRRPPRRAGGLIRRRRLAATAESTGTAAASACRHRPTMVARRAGGAEAGLGHRGCSSAGRAAALQAVGRGFESLHLHVWRRTFWGTVNVRTRNWTRPVIDRRIHFELTSQDAVSFRGASSPCRPLQALCLPARANHLGFPYGASAGGKGVRHAKPSGSRSRVSPAFRTAVRFALPGSGSCRQSMRRPFV